MSQKPIRFLSHLCFVLGFASIIASFILFAFARGGASAEALAHAERVGLFVGLWAPTFFILSSRLDRYADKAKS